MSDSDLVMPDFNEWAISIEGISTCTNDWELIKHDELVQALQQAFDQGRSYGARTTTTLKTTCSYKGVF